MTKKVCIAGYGAIGPVHAKALESVKGAVLYAVCDLNESKRKLCMEKYPVIAYDDFDRMLLDDDIDSVHICTPHYLHYEMVKKTLAAGKNVVVEKPVTMTWEQFAALKELEGAEKICVVLQNRLNPSVQKMKELVQEGNLGKVRAAKGVLTWCRDRTYYESDAWRGRWATEGGGVLINQAVHTLDYFSYLVGNVISVKANMFNYSLEDVIEVEDTFIAAMDLENGVKGLFFATNAYAENSAPYFEILFEKGKARYMDGQLWVNQQLVEEDTASLLGKAYWGSGHNRLLQQYYEEHKFFSLSDIENTMKTMFAMYESARNGGKPSSAASALFSGRF